MRYFLSNYLRHRRDIATNSPITTIFCRNGDKKEGWRKRSGATAIAAAPPVFLFRVNVPVIVI